MSLKTRKSSPITRHPLFPAVIALWGAVLFGGASFASAARLPEFLTRDLVLALGDAPGLAVQAISSVVFSLLGAVLGFVLGRTIAGADARARRPGRAKVPPRARTAVPQDDDNEDLARLQADRDTWPVRRRNAGARLADEALPEARPLAAATPTILSVGDLEEIEPLGTEPAHPANGAAPTGHAEPVIGEPVTGEAGTQSEATGFSPAAPILAVVADAPPAGAPRTVRGPAVLSLPPLLRPRSGTASAALRAAPLETLGVVELVERFALALAGRRDSAKAATVPVPESAFSAEDRAPAAPVASIAPATDEAPFRGTSATGRPFDMPAMLCPTPLDDEWDEADEANRDALLPPRTLLRGPFDTASWELPEAENEDEPEEDEGEAEAEGALGDDAAAPGERGYSSLLSMKPSQRLHGPADSAEALALASAQLAALSESAAGAGSSGSGPGTDEALRSALAALQRMSGAA